MPVARHAYDVPVWPLYGGGLPRIQAGGPAAEAFGAGLRREHVRGAGQHFAAGGIQVVGGRAGADARRRERAALRAHAGARWRRCRAGIAVDVQVGGLAGVRGAHNASLS